MDQKMFGVVVCQDDASRFISSSRVGVPGELQPVSYEGDGKLGAIAAYGEAIFGQRLIGVVPNREHGVVSNKKQEIITKQNPEGEIVSLPENRGSALALLIAALHIQKLQPGALMTMFLCDHIVRNLDGLRSALERAADRLQIYGRPVVLGLETSQPYLGIDHLRVRSDLNHRAAGEAEVFVIEEHVQKGDKDNASCCHQDLMSFWDTGLLIYDPYKLVSVLQDNIRIDGLGTIIQNFRDHGFNRYCQEKYRSMPYVPFSVDMLTQGRYGEEVEMIVVEPKSIPSTVSQKQQVA